MAIKVISSGDINQFRNIVFDVQRQAHFVGLDSDNNPIYDDTRLKPIISFKSTIKLHGSQGGISYNAKDGIWYQSRENIISVGKDNCGFAFFCEARKDPIMNIIEKIYLDNNISPNEYTVTILGEVVGRGVQKHVAISNLEKSFFIFAVKISQPDNPDFISQWVSCEGLRNPENRIYNIHDYKTYEVTIDFNKPELIQSELDKIVEEVENECPVAKAFGHSGLGEGVVLTGLYNENRLIFKAKGTKHAGTSKVKEISSIDNERATRIQEVAHQVTPVWRLQQFLTKVCDLQNHGQMERKYMGEYIKAINADIQKECLLEIAETGFDWSDISSQVAIIAREYWFEQEKL